MIKWIGQHIWDFISRFRNDVYLESLADPGSDTDKFLVVDANSKVGYRTGTEVLSDIGGGSGGIAFDGSTTDGVLTYKDADEATVEADLTYNSTTKILQSSSSASLGPYITLHNTDGGSGSSQFNFSNGASGDDGDSLGIINWGGQDDGGNAVVTWAQLNAKISDASDTTEEGEMNLTVIAQGSNRNGLNITANGSNVVDTTLGYGAASTTTIAGTLTMGSTAFVNNSGVVQVATQGTIDHDSLANFSADEHFTQANIVATGALNSGSITSGFGNIDIGSSTFDTTGAVSTGVITPKGIKHTISGNDAGDYGAGAEILYGISSDSVTAGSVYVLRSGVWTLIDADILSTVSQLVGIATIAAGSGDSSDGMIIKGCVTLASAYTAGTDTEGGVVYASTTAGEATLTAPTASNDFVRILGYSLNVSSKKMFLNPDSTWVEIA